MTTEKERKQVKIAGAIIGAAYPNKERINLIIDLLIYADYWMSTCQTKQAEYNTMLEAVRDAINFRLETGRYQ